MRNNYTIINVYEKQTLNSKVVTQLIYGDSFKKLKKIGKWIKIKNYLDGYQGFIKEKKFMKEQKNSHKVSSISAELYLKPNKRCKIKKKLSYGSKIKIIQKQNGFYKFDNLWVKKKDLNEITYNTKDVFKDVKKFINIKYKWGGKNYKGIDCSALVQLMMNFNNRYCPRDTKDQIKYFKRNIRLDNIKKNDLIFWKGHVAIAISSKKLIHAYGPIKKVVIMPIDKTIDRIYKTANLKVLSVKRFI
ncbi:MAG: multi-domain protein [Candidatus Pelagibacter sp. TMED64]|nr:multi-domain protein [Candidatus Pelagibacter sp.]OUU66227.1 MAG: multi-domain protein [Candidatus Pelagibacter sp. TMED64]